MAAGLSAVDASPATTSPQPEPRQARPARGRKQHLLDFADWSREELMALLDTTDVMAQVLTRTIKKVPALQGIYATRVHGVGDAPWPSVSSFGTRPTVDGVEPLLEAHLFDFSGDLYGRRIEVEFVARLRDEEKFPDLPTLVAQMHRDAGEARRILQQDLPGQATA